MDKNYVIRMDESRSFIANIRLLNLWTLRSPHREQDWKSMPKMIPRRPIYDVGTRWDAMYDMILQFLDLLPECEVRSFYWYSSLNQTPQTHLRRNTRCLWNILCFEAFQANDPPSIGENAFYCMKPWKVLGIGPSSWASCYRLRDILTAWSTTTSCLWNWTQKVYCKEGSFKESNICGRKGSN